jgi:5'-nucleotidase
MVGTLRASLLTLTLALALMLGLLAILASGAESQPALEDKTKTIQLLGVNDFHGNLESPRSIARGPNQPAVPVGGAAYLDAHLDEREAENPKGTIRVHAGDMVGASPLISSYFHDEPTVYAMNSMDFDVGTLGNHEFDEGGEEMLRLLRGGQRSDGKEEKDGPDGQPINTSDPDFPGADFPYTSANTVYAESGKNVLRPYRIVERKGVKVGFIGVTTDDTPNIVTPDEVAPFRFLDLSDSVNKYVRALRQQGVETIVVLAHEGGVQTPLPPATPTSATGEILTETAQMSDNVDVVIAGHSHSKLDNCVDDADGTVRDAATGGCGKDKLVVEAFSAGTAYDYVQMNVNRRTEDVAGTSAEVVTTYQDEVTPDERTAAIVAEYKAEISPISERVVATASEPILRTERENDNKTSVNNAGESELGDLIADAQRAFPAEQGSTPVDFAFMNPGGIRADIEQGPVTYGELFAVQPFDNQVVTMDLTGAQIYTLLDQQFPPNQAGSTTRILQVSGLTYTYDKNAPQGQRITNLTNTGGTTDAPIQNNDGTTYRVAVNSFIASGGDSFTVLKEGQNVETIGSDLDALEAYIDDEATFGPPADALTRITNATP